ncbi:rotatin-like [Chrysoperla carnea]|uniref:rotatin-like n=1 Tax=Chrysoperla carnea TaxID=189513 RepID=UPI001D05FA75|nr:rotatin-like [Chrysoperla carnea]
MLDKNTLNGFKRNTKNKSKESDRESNKFDDGTQIVGTELCQILIHLYDLHSVKSTEKPIVLSKRKSAIISALTSLLCVSTKAKKFALNDGFLEQIITQLQELHVKLSLESVESIRRASDKKRVCPILNDISCIFKLLTNFMLGNERVKLQAVSLGLADLIHKLWNWINFQQNLLIEVLRMLCTFTTECQIASQSITLTSPVAGVGPRKTPTTMSLLHCILHLIGKEMDLVSRSHDLKILTYSFHLLQNCCQAYECRVLISKSNFFQHLNRLHPAITKQQKPWESIELLWLEFLETLTFHPEGQVSVAKSSDTLELIMALTSSPHEVNKMTALAILRNITFYQANRTRLLSSGEFLQILNSKLSNGSIEEKCTCITIIWSLAANNQKAKLILKTSGLECRLQEVLKQWKLGESSLVPKEQLNNLQYIIEMLREGR